MGALAPTPATTPGVATQVCSADPLSVTDSPAYYGDNIPKMIGNSGTVLASATLGNLTLGTALDAVYGPTNNTCPGIWLYLPATALAAPNNVAGWYWAVMSSTTVGTVYTAQPANGGVAQLGVPASESGPYSAATPTYSLCWSPPLSSSLAIATGTGAGYTGVTAATAGPAYQMQGGTLQGSASVIFEGIVTANNSAGAKTARGVLSAAAALTSPVIAIAQAITTGVSALVARTFAMWEGLGSTGSTGQATTCLRFVTVGSTPTFATLDNSGTTYTGFTMQVAVATDWLILQSQYITLNPT
jgi:hypothetical protein